MAFPDSTAHPGYMYTPRPPRDNCCSVYIGNLDPFVTEDLLKLIFSQLGSISRCKMIHDSGTDRYCFVEYTDQETAERAIVTMNGRKVLQKPIKVNWATNTAQTKDRSSDHHIFVGDLSYEIDTETLSQAFRSIGTITDARVVKDAAGKSKGYGFVTFKNQEDAENAIKQMNGKVLGGRAIRTNWATRKGPYTAKDSTAHLNFQEVAVQTSLFNCTIYVGGLPQCITESQLRPYFQPYGQIMDTRVFADKCYAFVRFATHDQATHAICQMNGEAIGGTRVKCSWGKENPETQAMLQQQQFYYCYQQYQHSLPPRTQTSGYQYPHGYTPTCTPNGYTDQSSTQQQLPRHHQSSNPHSVFALPPPAPLMALYPLSHSSNPSFSYMLPQQ